MIRTIIVENTFQTMTSAQWARLVSDIGREVTKYRSHDIFRGGTSHTSEVVQYCWMFEINSANQLKLRKGLCEVIAMKSCALVFYAHVKQNAEIIVHPLANRPQVRREGAEPV